MNLTTSQLAAGIFGVFVVGLLVGGFSLAPISHRLSNVGEEPVEAALVDFSATEPTCGGERDSNVSHAGRPYETGRKVIFRANITASNQDNRLDAKLRRVGPEQFLLNIQRTQGGFSFECHAEHRYNATVNLPNPYTLIVAHDGRIRHVSTHGPGGGGSFGNVLPEKEE